MNTRQQSAAINLAFIAVSFSNGILRRKSDHTPRRVSGFYPFDDGICGQIDDGDVVRRAVGAVEILPIRRKRDTPRAISYFNRARDLIRGCIDDEDTLPSTRADIGRFSIG